MLFVLSLPRKLQDSQELSRFSRVQVLKFKKERPEKEGVDGQASMTGTFTKLNDKDFESKPCRVDTDRKFETRLPGQAYVALNVAHRERKPTLKDASSPAFRVIGMYGTVEEATEALASSREEGCDGVVAAAHAPILLSVRSGVRNEEEVCRDIIRRCAERFRDQKKKVERRVEMARAVEWGCVEDGKGGGADDGALMALEAKEYETAPAAAKSARKPGVRNLDTDAVVVSLVGAHETEPVLVVYATFKSVDDARIYTLNNLGDPSVCPYDVSIVASNEWHFGSSFCVENTDLDDVDYFDKGLSTLMNIPRSSRSKMAELKRLIPEDKYIQPEPDLACKRESSLSAAAKALLASAD